MTYGTSLALPADLVTNTADEMPDPIGFAATLKDRMAKVRTATSRSTDHREQYIPTDLPTCKYVLVRTDSHRQPLQRPYTGPYEVLSRKRYTYLIKTNNGHKNIAIHRLKPARLDAPVLQPDIPRRRGRPSNRQPSS
jgi:cleavage and polyadenylation specificity factor subunit 1